MTFNFDLPIDRHSTASTKWDKYAGRDILPFWVADSDFASPPCVIEALHARADHGVFGYTDPSPRLNLVIVDHLAQQYGWQVEPGWLLWLPGLVAALNVVARAFCQPGQQVITATPVYPPFLTAPIYQGREVLRLPLRESAGHWQWDLDALDTSDLSRAKVLSLCSPHNPVGRVWTVAELEALAERAQRHDWILCSDEIHCGLILDAGKAHRPIASLSPEIADRSITLMSASKTFNLPGLGCAFAVVPSPALRTALKRAAAGIVSRVNAMGFAATEAAYRDGASWQSALIDYLRGNRDLVMDALGSIPALRVFPVEATYLAWIDARGIGQNNPHAFFEAAGVGLSDGAEFGAPGFVRLNFGCTRALLRDGLERMRKAVVR